MYGDFNVGTNWYQRNEYGEGNKDCSLCLLGGVAVVCCVCLIVVFLRVQSC